MAIGLVHEIQTLVAFGLPYGHIHRRKDAAARRLPGLPHRRICHGWYQRCGRLWTLDEPFPNVVRERTKRLADSNGPVRAEEYMVWVSHDFFDKIWDFDGCILEERTYRRKWWEGFFIWLLFRPDILRDWAGVDVLLGKIHRVIDGN